MTHPIDDRFDADGAGDETGFVWVDDTDLVEA